MLKTTRTSAVMGGGLYRKWTRRRTGEGEEVRQPMMMSQSRAYTRKKKRHNYRILLMGSKRKKKIYILRGNKNKKSWLSWTCGDVHHDSRTFPLNMVKPDDSSPRRIWAVLVYSVHSFYWRQDEKAKGKAFLLPTKSSSYGIQSGEKEPLLLSR